MNQQTVLLVEDNDDDIELTLRSFERHHLARVEVVRDGQQALDYLFKPLRTPPPVPGLILLDLKLPKVGGLEVLKRIRTEPRTRYVPVVVMSTSTESRDKMQCYDRGANSYVRKPIDFDRFLETTRQLGTYWLLLNECGSAGH